MESIKLFENNVIASVVVYVDMRVISYINIAKAAHGQINYV